MFDRQRLTVAGCEIVLLTAGARDGAPLVYLHGETDTLTGFDFLLPWAERFRLLIPVHPGFGESDDDPSISCVGDLVLHYVQLFDDLGLEQAHLVGQSLGGWIAASFATQHDRRVDRLALVAPFGLRSRRHPGLDLFRLKPAEYLSRQATSMAIFPPEVRELSTVDVRVSMYREQTSLARVAWERNYDPKLARWLHRVSMPTLLAWGDDDQVVPSGQAEEWASLLPDAQVRTFAGYGHLLLQESTLALHTLAEFLDHA